MGTSTIDGSPRADRRETSTRSCCENDAGEFVDVVRFQIVSDAHVWTSVGGRTERVAQRQGRRFDDSEHLVAADRTRSSIPLVLFVFQRCAVSELRYALREFPFKPLSAERRELDPPLDLRRGPAAAQAPTRPRVDTADVDAGGLRAFCSPCHGRTSIVIPLFTIMMGPAGRKGQFDRQGPFASDVLEPTHTGGAGVRPIEGAGRTRQTRFPRRAPGPVRGCGW